MPKERRSLTVSAPVGTTSAVLSFDLLTFRSLDGVLNCCTDTFTFAVNGTTAFTGAFGAVPSVGFFTNPSLASFVELGAGSFGNSGTVRFTVNVALAPGANLFNWSFSPLQSLADEAWGLDNVVLSTSDVPEPRTFFLAFLSLVVLWRKQL